MPTAAVQQDRAKIALESERLIITWIDDNENSQRRNIPLRDLERLIFTETATITAPALAETLRRSIPVTLIDSQGRFLGSFLPATPDHGASRLLHYQRTLDPAFALELAGKIITAKIYNQRRLLQRIMAFRRSNEGHVPVDILRVLNGLEQDMAAAGRAKSIDTLRGHEGLAAARYFPCWAELLPPEFPFERRSTRPPHNPVNAALSFTSVLLYNEMHAALHTRGLDAALGLLHVTENGRWSLALDLMEPFRPVVAEALTLDLFSRKILNASHFEPHNSGIWLTREGRAKLLLQYEKRMERQFMSESVGHRTSLRQQLENQAGMYKSALDDPAVFEPFLMN